MSEGCAELLVEALGIYAAFGAVFGVAFVARGAARTDPAARGAGLGFRTAILPGVVLLWPVLAWRWWSARAEPSEPWGAPLRVLRLAHRWSWRALAVLVPLGLTAALCARPEWPSEPEAVAEISSHRPAEATP
jgi:hypothetical protein